jgi:hypothetical protein
MHCCLMIRRKVRVVFSPSRVGVVFQDDVLSHGVYCFSNLYSQYETGFAGFAARCAVR